MRLPTCWKIVLLLLAATPSRWGLLRNVPSSTSFRSTPRPHSPHLQQPYPSRRQLLAGLSLLPALPLSLLAGELPVSSSLFRITESGDIAPNAQLSELLEADVVFLGETHNRLQDHLLQREFLARAAAGPGPVSVGLEMVEQEFQPALDRYIQEGGSDREAEQRLYRETEWDKRWVWELDLYLPVLQLARERGIKLVALNTNSDLLRHIPSQGLQMLTSQQRRQYVPDPQGFIDTSRLPGFSAYTNQVITPSFEAHLQMGILPGSPTLPNFFAARILRDEAMCSAAARYLREQGAKDAKMLMLVGADHVKFQYGCPVRMRRMVEGKRVASVLLNPSPSDTLSDTQMLRTSLVNPQTALSDFVWFS